MKGPLIASVSLYASAALMVAELRGADGNEDTTNKPQCETPEPPFCNSSDYCFDADFLFIYNATSGLCEETEIDRRYHNGSNIFDTRFECVSTCSPTQGAPFCAESPLDVCNDTEICDEREWMFYNITSEQCEPYQYCGEGGPKTDYINGRYNDINCKFQCGGFSLTNVYGINKTEEAEG
uniref:Putative serine proteinase inhibitor n=1 Tax=Amblyomma cajennense TaxID=34607 RepID=A0A023FTK6_AMBCJ